MKTIAILAVIAALLTGCTSAGDGKTIVKGQTIKVTCV
jgi:predicted small secreted protein